MIRDSQYSAIRNGSGGSLAATAGSGGSLAAMAGSSEGRLAAIAGGDDAGPAGGAALP